MIDSKNEYGKLHLILELIGRKDIRKSLEERFTKDEQIEIFNMFQSIIADEMNFVMAIREKEREIQSPMCFLTQRNLQ